MILYKSHQTGGPVKLNFFEDIRYRDWEGRNLGYKDRGKSKYDFKSYWKAGGRNPKDTQTLENYKTPKNNYYDQSINTRTYDNL